MPAEREADIDCMILAVIESLSSGGAAAAMSFSQVTGTGTARLDAIGARYRPPPTFFVVETCAEVAFSRRRCEKGNSRHRSRINRE